jgi:hypothetical protein
MVTYSDSETGNRDWAGGLLGGACTYAQLYRDGKGKKKRNGGKKKFANLTKNRLLMVLRTPRKELDRREGPEKEIRMG